MRTSVGVGLSVCMGLVWQGCAPYRAAGVAEQLLPEIDIVELRDDATQALRKVAALERRVDSLAQALAEAPRRSAGRPVPGPPTEPADPVVPPVPSVVPERPAGEVYQAGLESFQQRDYSRASEQFAAIVRRAPEGPYAANAWYWLGECLLRLERSAAARAAFEKLVAGFPASEYAARARQHLERLR